MTSAGASGRDLMLLDAVCAAMDRPRRPLDFTVIVDVPASLSLDRLRTGARSARRCYPVSGACLVEGRWQPGHEPADAGVQSAARSDDVTRVLQEFVDEPLDLRTMTPVRQVLLDVGESRAMLASRCHHAAADGTGVAAWLGHQLAVALGDRDPAAVAGSWAAPVLRPTHGQIARATRQRLSASLWRQPGRPARARRWRTIEIARLDRRERFGRGHFTYSDVLAATTLDVLGAWNRSHGAGQAAPVGLWVPISVRAAGDTAFGNATSRVRVHATYPAQTPFEAKCLAVHEQISNARRSGEWRVPESHLADRLPWALRARVLRAYLSRPWADIGTASFSHIDRWAGPPAEVFDRASSIECVASLHAGHPLAITGVTRRQRTWLTFTYDAALLTDRDVASLTDAFLDAYAVIRRSLACAA